ncbi:thioesterase II family protein [Azohydromonas lata]|uniref:thioesterase II family protein n=1 Tax=Azohydromonas lata TaxID=45677 RepID=UPI00082C19A7|nr:alpha/beta fold hydrolase [Azohydromonas lata]
MAARWFLPLRTVPAQSRALRVLTLPHAGAPLRCYRWLEGCVGDDVELWTVALPGRGKRRAEEAHTSVHSIVEALADELPALAEEPYVLYGHSMGALLAFELARVARRRGLALPVALLLSGARSPESFLIPQDPPCSQWPQGKLVDHLRALGGVAPELLAYGELLELFLPAVRADYALCERYEPRAEPPLPVAMALMSGTEDRDVDDESLTAWGAHATGPVVMRKFLGDRFFINGHRRELPAFVTTLLQHCKAGQVKTWNADAGGPAPGMQPG